jgi:hypothetical protein
MGMVAAAVGRHPAGAAITMAPRLRSASITTARSSSRGSPTHTICTAATAPPGAPGRQQRGVCVPLKG